LFFMDSRVVTILSKHLVVLEPPKKCLSAITSSAFWTPSEIGERPQGSKRDPWSS
jgi:hypothetical protein